MEVNEKEMIEICEKIRKCEEEISKGIIGQKNIIREVLIAIFADGNVLLEGMPEMCIRDRKSLISNGRVTESNLFMGILTDDPTALSYTGSILFDISTTGYQGGQGTQGTIEKVQLDEKIIGENSLNIDGLDVILINNYNMSKLKKEQYTALTSWLNKGGTLIIGAGANESKTINNIDKNFLDIKSKGTKEKNVKIVDESLNLVFSDLEVKDGKVKIGDNTNPLVYSVNKGKGCLLYTSRCV